MKDSGRPARSFLLRFADACLYAVLEGTASILRAFPTRWVTALGSASGTILYVLDGRGRRVGFQNLAVAFGDGKGKDQKRRILLASMRNMVTSVLMLLHVSPMTAKRYSRWVELPADVRKRFQDAVFSGGGGIGCSGHVGNWELLLGLQNAMPEIPGFMFLAETLSSPAVDRFFARLRGSGGGETAIRRGGARALMRHIQGGGSAGVLVDRNVRRDQGGIWVPFLGLQARTTPLPGWISRRQGTHIVPVFCLPLSNGRYRWWAGPNLAEGVGSDDEDADVYEVTKRLNEVLERVIRAQPELWNWTLKRFKSRPTRELGPYPAYSLWDPDQRSA